MSDCRIVKLIHVHHDYYIKIRNSYKRDKNEPLFNARLEDLKLKSRSLFDVATCKCTMTVNCRCQKTPDACQCAILIKCLCEKTKENPYPRVQVHVSSKELQFGENRIY